MHAIRLPAIDSTSIAAVQHSDEFEINQQLIPFEKDLQDVPLIASSRSYGLTIGGINAEEFALTDLGARAASDDPAICVPALKAAVMNVPPYKAFFDRFSGTKVPSGKPLTEFLTRDAGVDGDRADEAGGIHPL
ncbi:MAG: hypothetical protein ACLP50_13990 [Solirubrobacteraceae bacterium]